jgi:hypothetical protein
MKFCPQLKLKVELKSFKESQRAKLKISVNVYMHIQKNECLSKIFYLFYQAWSR